METWKMVYSEKKMHDEKFSNMLLIHNATIHSDKILKFLATGSYLEMTDSEKNESKKNPTIRME